MSIRILWTVAERELLEQMTSLRFLVIAVLVVLLTPLTIYVGNNNYLARVQSYQQLSAARNGVRAQMDKVMSGVYGQDVSWTPYNDLEPLRVLRPPEKFSVLIKGLDPAMPLYWDFSASGTQSGPPASPAFWMADLLGALDLEFVIRVVLGLLAILIAFDAIAGEKESGTLRLALSHPVSRPVFWIGKMLGGAISLLVPLTLVLLVAVISGEAMGVGLSDRESVAKISSLFVVSSGYLVALYALGLLVSSLAQTQKNAMVVLLVCWVMLVLAAPPLAILIARAAAPVDSIHLYEAQKRSLGEDLDIEKEYALGKIFTDSKGHLSSAAYRTENKAVLDDKISLIEGDFLKRRRRLLGEVDQRFQRANRRQTLLANAIMLASPAALFAHAATSLAGTGDPEREAWLAAVNQHQTTLTQVVFENDARVSARSQGGSMSFTRREPPKLSDVPAFVPPNRNLRATLGETVLPAAILFLFWGVFVFAGLAAFYRYDVR